jgi:hypothetical protein
VLHYTRLKRLFSDKHSSLLGAFVSCEENDCILYCLARKRLEVFYEVKRASLSRKSITYDSKKFFFFKLFAVFALCHHCSVFTLGLNVYFMSSGNELTLLGGTEQVWAKKWSNFNILMIILFFSRRHSTSFCALYYKFFTIVIYERKVRFSLQHTLLL